MPACGSGDENGAAAAGGTTSGGEASSGAADSGGDGSAGDGASAPFDTSTLDEGPGEVAADFDASEAFVTRLAAPRLGLSSSPHRLQQIFYSANLEPVLGRTAFGALPEGSVAVKIQSRDGDDVIDQVMVMLKQPHGTDPERGDWIWEQRRPGTLALVSSSADDEGFRDFCAGCHGGYAETDWLAGTGLAD